MSMNLEEQERIDALKDWWGRNGNRVMWALAALLAAFSAWQGWRWYEARQNADASVLYHAVVQGIERQDWPRMQSAAQELLKNYGRTGYAEHAALLAAGANFRRGEVKAAGAQLAWATEHIDDPVLRDLARLRLAQVRFDLKDYAGALQLLDAPHGESYRAAYSDLKGDVLQAQNRPDQARAAYQVAFEAAKADEVFRRFVGIKLDGLGGPR